MSNTDKIFAALNDYAAIEIDPAVAALTDDGMLMANDESWGGNCEFAPDETMFGFLASMLEMAPAVEEKQIGDFCYQVASTEDEDEGTVSTFYVAQTGLPGCFGFMFMINAQKGASLTDFEAMLATLAIDSSAIPAFEPSLPKLEDDWATVEFDADTADLRYHTVEAKDGSWSVEFGLPMNEYGAETSKNDYKLITLGYGDQTDIVTGDKALGAFDYRTLRYNQNGKACAYYDCTFAQPKNVTAKTWDGSEEAQQVYGVYIQCKADDGAVLDELETIIASLAITEA